MRIRVYDIARHVGLETREVIRTAVKFGVLSRAMPSTDLTVQQAKALLQKLGTDSKTFFAKLPRSGTQTTHHPCLDRAHFNFEGTWKSVAQTATPEPAETAESLRGQYSGQADYYEESDAEEQIAAQRRLAAALREIAADGKTATNQPLAALVSEQADKLECDAERNSDRLEACPLLAVFADDETEANKPYRPKARFWQRVDNLRDEELHRLIRYALRVQGELLCALLANASRRPVALEAVKRLAMQVLEALERGARTDNASAGRALVETLITSIERLNGAVKTNPKKVRDFAGRFERWPVVDSPHPYLREDRQAIFRSFGVGSQSPLMLDQYAKWHPNNTFSRIAGLLQSYVQNVREKSAEFLEQEVGHKLIVRAGKLPEFSRDSAAQWWAVSESFLLEAFGDPHHPANLDYTAKLPDGSSLEDHLSGESEKTTPGRKRSKIKGKVKQKFFNMARL